MSLIAASFTTTTTTSVIDDDDDDGHERDLPTRVLPKKLHSNMKILQLDQKYHKIQL
jgi:hypothetical protein